MSKALSDDVLRRLREYVRLLDLRINFHKKWLDNLPKPKHPEDDNVILMREPVAREYAAWAGAKRDLFRVFPELKERTPGKSKKALPSFGRSQK